MNLFDSQKIEKQEKSERSLNKKMSLQKHVKRYGTKKPSKRVNKHELLISWRDDL